MPIKEVSCISHAARAIRTLSAGEVHELVTGASSHILTQQNVPKDQFIRKTSEIALAETESAFSKQ